MSQYVRPGSSTTVAVNDVISITTPQGTLDFTGNAVGNSQIVIPDLAYHHVQNTASSLWEIPHNLDFYPNVTIIDSAGTIVEGEIEYLSRNSIRATFSAAFSGNAYLS